MIGDPAKMRVSLAGSLGGGFGGYLFGAPEEVESEGGEEADHRVGDVDAGEDEEAEAREDDERGVETGSLAGLRSLMVAEETSGEGFEEESQEEDCKREWKARGYGEGSRRGEAA